MSTGDEYLNCGCVKHANGTRTWCPTCDRSGDRKKAEQLSNEIRIRIAQLGKLQLPAEDRRRHLNSIKSEINKHRF